MKASLDNLQSETIYSRKLTGSRDLRRGLRMERARQVIGKLEPGCEVYGFTKGQFCLVHILEHCLEQTGGPARVDIATWSAAAGDIRSANRMVRLKAIGRLRFVVDFSFPSRKPQFCEELVNTFGEDCIRVTSIHAKFMTIQSGDWNLVIRTSMNLNYNPRFENFEISDDPGLLRFMETIVDEIFEKQEVGEGFTNRPYENKKQFERVGLDGMNPGEFAGVNLDPVSELELADLGGLDLDNLEGIKI